MDTNASEPVTLLPAGEWTLQATATCPGQPARESRCTATFESILDGQSLLQTTRGNMDDMPLVGFQVLGYDHVHQKYVGAWLDGMNAGMRFITTV